VPDGTERASMKLFKCESVRGEKGEPAVYGTIPLG